MSTLYAIDAGTTNIGFSVLRFDGGHDQNAKKEIMHRNIDLNTVQILESKSHLTSDARKKHAEHMLRKRARKTKNHKTQRLNKLAKLLQNADFLPASKLDIDSLNKGFDPLETLIRGYDEMVDRHDLGAVLMFLARSRGMASDIEDEDEDDAEGENEGSEENSEASDDQEKDATANAKVEKKRNRAAAKLANKAIKEYGYRTVHELMFKQKEFVTKPPRYPDEQIFIVMTRDMVRSSLDLFLKRQREFYPEIDDELSWWMTFRVCDQTIQTINNMVGFCHLDSVDNKENRDRRERETHPLISELNIYQAAHNMRVPDLIRNEGKRPLTIEERDAAVAYLKAAKKPTKTDLKSHLGIPNLIYCDNKDEKVAKNIFDNMMREEHTYGEGWDNLSMLEKCSIYDALTKKYSERKECLEAMDGLTDRQISNLLAVDKIVHKHSKWGKIAAAKVLEVFKTSEYVISMHDAKIKAGYDYRVNGLPPERQYKLPYYGEILPQMISNQDFKALETEVEKHYGKISNAVVHKILNLLRHVINEAITKYGMPAYITIETTRDLKTASSLEAHEKRLKKGKKYTTRYENYLEEFGIEHSTKTRKVYDLVYSGFHEGNPQTAIPCIICGEHRTSLKDFMSGNHEFEECHILPRSKTGDNAKSNLFMGCRKCNMVMGNMYPQENPSFDKAFLKQIRTRAAIYYSAATAKRFGDKAHENQDFAARMIVDTAFVSKAMITYLSCLFDEKNRWRVGVTNGAVTSALRKYWFPGWVDKKKDADKENPVVDKSTKEADKTKKDRNDPRHHALDSLVIAFTDQKIIEQVRRAIDEYDRRRAAGTESRYKYHPPLDSYVKPLPLHIIEQMRVLFEDPGMIDESRKRTKYLEEPKHGQVRGILKSSGVAGNITAATIYSPVIREEDIEVEHTKRLVRQSIDVFRTKFNPTDELNPDLFYSRKTHAVPNSDLKYSSKSKLAQTIINETNDNYISSKIESYTSVLRRIMKKYGVTHLHYYGELKYLNGGKVTGYSAAMTHGSLVSYAITPNINNRQRGYKRKTNSIPSGYRLMAKGNVTFVEVYKLKDPKKKLKAGVGKEEMIENYYSPGQPAIAIDDPDYELVLRVEKGDVIDYDVHKGVAISAIIRSGKINFERHGDRKVIQPRIRGFLKGKIRFSQ